MSWTKDSQDKIKDTMFSMMISSQLKSIAEQAAIRSGRSLAGYIRYLITKDNE